MKLPKSYYGVFVKLGRKYIRIDTTTGYTLETAKEKFRPIVLALLEKGLKAEFRLLQPVPLTDAWSSDKKYAKTPW